MSESTLPPVVDDTGPKPPARPRQRFVRQAGRLLGGDGLLHYGSAAAGLLIIGMLLLLLAVLVLAARPAVMTFGYTFLTSTTWRPNALEQPRRDANGYLIRDADGEVIMDTIPPTFGALAVIYGTTVSSIIALLLAVPVSFGAAVFLVRIAPDWLVPPVSFLVEFLAAIPSIAFGIWGLLILSPFLREYIERPLNTFFAAVPGLRLLALDGDPSGRDMFCGGIVLAIMIIPIITAISRDVLMNVPRAQVEGSIALGSTWWQSCMEMLKYSRSALFGAVMLGLARAAGETMAVTMVIGNHNAISASIFAPAQTMSSLLASEFADANDELQRSALAMVALILLVMSLSFNVVARWLVVGKNSRSAAAH
jgi:phosphate transport system permease protein